MKASNGKMKDSSAPGYDRKQKIIGVINAILRSIPRIIWGINIFPLFLLLCPFNFMILLSLPFSLIVWLFIGNRPVYRMQPTNFFLMLFMGSIHGENEYGNIQFPENFDSETPSMKMVYQLAVDLQFFSVNHYMNLYKYYFLGKVHPDTGLKCYMHIRLLAITLYALVTWPYVLIIMKIISYNCEVQPEAEYFNKI